MADKPLQGMKVAILVTDGFEQVELTSPRKALEEAGATTSVISPQAETVLGMNHIDKADTFPVDIRLENVDPTNFDAVLLPGGAVNADALRVEAKAQAFVRHMYESNKPVAVICHGPWLLVSAGLVKNRTLTSYHTIQDDIKNAGGKWVDQEVVRDELWVSSRNPNDLDAFNKAIVQVFAENRSNVAGGKR